MRYIVAGGAGFVGSNLANTLSQHHDVVIIDNLTTGRRVNIEHHLAGFQGIRARWWFLPSVKSTRRTCPHPASAGAIAEDLARNRLRYGYI